MRIVVHGQEAFGKAVLEKLLERKEDVVAVFCAPDKAGRAGGPAQGVCQREGPARPSAEELEDARSARADEVLQADLCIMAYVTLFVPQPVLDAPQARHLPVSSLAAACASRAVVHQLADRDGQDADGSADLLAGRRTR